MVLCTYQETNIWTNHCNPVKAIHWPGLSHVRVHHTRNGMAALEQTEGRGDSQELSWSWRMNGTWLEKTSAFNYTVLYLLSILGASRFTSPFIHVINLRPLSVLQLLHRAKYFSGLQKHWKCPWFPSQMEGVNVSNVNVRCLINDISVISVFHENVLLFVHNIWDNFAKQIPK